MALNINSRVADPRGSIDPMTASFLSWDSEIPVTDLAQIGEAHICWTLPHSHEELFIIVHFNDIINDTNVKGQSSERNDYADARSPPISQEWLYYLGSDHSNLKTSNRISPKSPPIKALSRCFPGKK